MKKRDSGIFVHSLFLVSVTGILFSACKKNERYTINDDQDGTKPSITQQVVPNGFTAIAFEQLTKDDAALIQTTKRNEIITLDHELLAEADKDFIRKAVYDYNIPVILVGEKGVDNDFISGFKPGCNAIALVYNHKGQGITVETFSEKRLGDFKKTSVENIFDSNRINLSASQRKAVAGEALKKDPSLDVQKAWKEYDERSAAFKKENENLKPVEKVAAEGKNNNVPLAQQADAIKKQYTEDLLSLYKKNSSVTVPGISNLVSSPDLSNYKIRTIVWNMYPGQVEYSAEFVPFKYRLFTQIAQGSYTGQSDTRTFVNMTFVGDPGVTATARNESIGSNDGACSKYDDLYDLMTLFQPEVLFPTSFAYDDFYPVAQSNGSGTYSNNQSFSIKLKPFKPEEFAELAFTAGKSYSYSMPDYYFTNQTTEGTLRSMQWKFQAGNCVNGSFSNGNGLLKSWAWQWEELFYDASQTPVPMRQTNNIGASVNISRPYNNSNFSLVYYITTEKMNSRAKSAFWFCCLGGNTWIDSYKTYYKHFGISSDFNPAF